MDRSKRCLRLDFNNDLHNIRPKGEGDADTTRGGSVSDMLRYLIPRLGQGNTGFSGWIVVGRPVSSSGMCAFWGVEGTSQCLDFY